MLENLRNNKTFKESKQLLSVIMMGFIMVMLVTLALQAFTNISIGTGGRIFTSGTTLSCYNGTWVNHELPDDPHGQGSITLSLRGPSAYNATFIFRVPTVLSSNATHFQIEFLAWETAGWTQVPVTSEEAQTVYWIASYTED